LALPLPLPRTWSIDALASRVSRSIGSAGALVLALSSVGCAASVTAPAVAPTLSPLLAKAPLLEQYTAPEEAVATLLAENPSPWAGVAWTASDARCPADMALVGDRVCVDRWENALVERVPGGTERFWPPYMPPDGKEARLRAVSRPDVLPQGYISGVQAKGMCRASGKHLCAPDEWDVACRGSAKTTFPYGAERRAGVCNDDIRAVHPVAEVALLVGLPSTEWWSAGMNNPLINQLPSGLLETGARASCTNDYGVYDMVGNLHEWVDDSDGTFRGGYYMDTTLNGEGCSYQTTAHDFDYHDYSTGFRCCAEPDRVE
jgi:sulfatase modifying factor 1